MSWQPPLIVKDKISFRRVIVTLILSLVTAASAHSESLRRIGGNLEESEETITPSIYDTCLTDLAPRLADPFLPSEAHVEDFCSCASTTIVQTMADRGDSMSGDDIAYDVLSKCLTPRLRPTIVAVCDEAVSNQDLEASPAQCQCFGDSIQRRVSRDSVGFFADPHHHIDSAGRTCGLKD